MKNFRCVAMILAAAMVAACGTTTTGTGGGTAATDTSGGGSDTAGQQGDSTKNKADLKLTDDTNATVDVKGEKVATAGDATAKTWGATNADTVLNLNITEAGTDGSKAITIFIDTAKHPLPATGIPVGVPNSDVWVTYTVASATATGVYNSKDKGTIDVSPCPAAGKAIVGTLKGVVLYNEGGTGPKTITMDGTFNLVYFAGAGAVKCTEAAKDTDAGGTGGGEKSPYAPPKGSSCDADPCDGGANTTRMCCPYGDCIAKCSIACTSDIQKCITDCDLMDPTCPVGCQTKVFTCIAGCPDECGASAECKTAMANYGKCEEKNQPTCGGEGKSEEQTDACIADACCAEIKAAF